MKNELQEWEARKVALKNGYEWNESHMLEGMLEGRTDAVSADRAKELVESGLFRRCGQCSSPHRSIYHLAGKRMI